MKSIRHQALYNNYVHDLLKEMEDNHAEFSVYPRLLAMEADLKQWVEAQLHSNQPTGLITDAMLGECDDYCTAIAQKMNLEITDLLRYLDQYWRTTAEVNAEEN